MQSSLFCLILFSLLSLFVSCLPQYVKKYTEKENKNNTKRESDLHELPYTELVKSGTILLASAGSVSNACSCTYLIEYVTCPYSFRSAFLHNLKYILLI